MKRVGKRMKRTKPIQVLAVAEKHLPSFIIGISQPFRLLQQRGICVLRVKSESQLIFSDIADADLIIFVRSYKHFTYKYLKLAHWLKKRTVYSIDDHYAALPKDSSFGMSFHQGRHERDYVNFLKRAHIVRVASKYFRNHIRADYRNKDVVYFPGCVDFSLFKGLKKRQTNDDHIVIGYAGNSKAAAFRPVLPALKRILNEYAGKVRLEFWGYVPEQLAQSKFVTFNDQKQPYQRFIQNMFLNRWDIGIAPLSNTLFDCCKTNNKYREYAACGIPGVYSDSPAYADSVLHQRTGYLVPHTENGWYEGLKNMIERPGLREKIRTRAYLHAKKRYSVEACADAWYHNVLLRAFK